ncbi:MAG: tRNA (adenosine(37)-N6)-dimethylallyltransferase MiaA [Clostridia bacterium]|nr:tRNA (adenosine(37)-N6)-dimethylallyltransferase MiaA [Clostridia bacterium]
MDKQMIRALALTGPTASGKTAFSIKLAENLSGEIISCDSMQIYRGMDIGTAKATPEERAAVRHHMLDLVDPESDFSVESYRAGALAVAEDIVARGKTPIFVGGTGLYVDAVMRAPMCEVPESSREYREKMLAAITSDADVDALWQRLFEIDPESAAAIHKNNLRRVVRAIEIYEMTGKTKSYFDKLSKSKSADFDVKIITLDVHNRESLYKRIDTRVDLMMKEGLLSEVKDLYESGKLKKGTTAAQAIGYKEIISYLDGEASLEDAVELIKLSSRRYAKRQLTWFRHEEGASRVYLDREDGVMRGVDEIFAEILTIAEEQIRNF